jgi:hypothetical protein
LKEDFLHYVWKFRKFDTEKLRTTKGKLLDVLSPGLHNFNSGPDFFNGLILIDDQQWAGNIEIHLRSSHWYTHRHHEDTAYDSVILHVVWTHDRTVFRSNGTEIPTLVLKNAVDALTLARYRKLFSRRTTWIPCENEFYKVDEFSVRNWLERLYVERLECKSLALITELEKSISHWEAMLFRMLCRNFGLKVNGDSFYSIASSIDFSIVRKCCHDRRLLEALLLGQARMLEENDGDEFYMKLRKSYDFLKLKFNLVNTHVIRPQNFRLRPANFPGIRLAQLAALYSKQPHLFSEIISATNTDQLYRLLDCQPGTYWSTHYSFGKKAPERRKELSRKFKDLLILNTIIPVRFCYNRSKGNAVDEVSLEMAAAIASEENSIIKKFSQLGRKAGNAIESQGLLQLKTVYCDKKQCLQCQIGNNLLSNK